MNYNTVYVGMDDRPEYSHIIWKRRICENVYYTFFITHILFLHLSFFQSVISAYRQSVNLIL